MKNKALMRQITDYASAEMKTSSNPSEVAALELLYSVSLWLGEYYQHCENPDHPMPTIQPTLKNIHKLL